MRISYWWKSATRSGTYPPLAAAAGAPVGHGEQLLHQRAEAEAERRRGRVLAVVALEALTAAAAAAKW